MALAAGILMAVVDRDNSGQLLATLITLFGLGFLTVITASITSAHVSQAQRERRRTAESALMEQCREIEERLDRIEPPRLLVSANPFGPTTWQEPVRGAGTRDLGTGGSPTLAQYGGPPTPQARRSEPDARSRRGRRRSCRGGGRGT
jgi:hypothetical protein